MVKVVLHRKANNLCARCAKPMDRVGLCCIDCTCYLNIQRKKEVNATHEKGLCTCCKNPLDRKGWFCIECNEVLKQHQRNRVARRKAAGECIQCGLKAAEGRSRCRVCLDKNKLAIRASREAKKVEKKNGKSRTEDLR